MRGACAQQQAGVIFFEKKINARRRSRLEAFTDRIAFLPTRSCWNHRDEGARALGRKKVNFPSEVRDR